MTQVACRFLTVLVLAARSIESFRPDGRLSLQTARFVSTTRDDNPFRQVDIDLEKARDYANHFGKYPVKEVEKMRDGRWKRTCGG